MIYKVVLSENTVVVVTAKDFEVSDEHKRVFFIDDNNQRCACFNLNNVLGFYSFQDDDEEPRNYIERFCQ